MLSLSTWVAAVARRLMSSGSCDMPFGLPPNARPYGLRFDGTAAEYEAKEWGGDTLGDATAEAGADREKLLGGGIIVAMACIS